MWRYWRCLPTRGRIGIYAGSWYTETLREDAKGRKAIAQLDHELRRIRRRGVRKHLLGRGVDRREPLAALGLDEPPADEKVVLRRDRRLHCLGRRGVIKDASRRAKPSAPAGEAVGVFRSGVLLELSMPVPFACAMSDRIGKLTLGPRRDVRRPSQPIARFTAPSARIADESYTGKGEFSCVTSRGASEHARITPSQPRWARLSMMCSTVRRDSGLDCP